MVGFKDFEELDGHSRSTLPDVDENGLAEELEMSQSLSSIVGDVFKIMTDASKAVNDAGTYGEAIVGLDVDNGSVDLEKGAFIAGKNLINRQPLSVQEEIDRLCERQDIRVEPGDDIHVVYYEGKEPSYDLGFYYNGEDEGCFQLRVEGIPVVEGTLGITTMEPRWCKYPDDFEKILSTTGRAIVKDLKPVHEGKLKVDQDILNGQKEKVMSALEALESDEPATALSR
ncbi:hypothetical protein [Sulfitobacter sp. R18_1]|uniref:hypothetical protein n=1 Tax=Sulfitobacter sp. R18_1 TaxID=2821104 RepID=UPI001AD9A167|nr:hypothetical protein [Sulfitobacter sp. R18_1]MBO9428180.1 hypothetical protein [Sulfitobacter sp. R18_1]